MNPNRALVRAALAGLCLLLAAPALAWGPRAQVTINTTALNLLAKEGNVPLNRLQREMREGVQVDMDSIRARHPNFDADPVAAIEAEMLLLQTMRGERVDAYFVYRMGILGKMVAHATAPLREAPARYRNSYYDDADGAIDNLALRPVRRDLVEPRTYFPALLRAAAARDDVIREEYDAGIRFQGVARSSLSEDVSRSIDAVADVWHTILSGPRIPASLSSRQRDGYVLEAFRFYIGRGNTAEIETVTERLAAQVSMTADMQVEIGDMFFENEFFDQAVAYYRRALEQAPGRRDVVEKVAAYYVMKGEEALEANRLEAAAEAFANALDANALHPTAERRRLEAEAMIAERDGRLRVAQAALEAAAELERLAEQEAMDRRYAEAVALLQEAIHQYENVTNEFPAEYQRAQGGLRNLRIRIQETRDELVANAQMYSGSFLAEDLARIAAKHGRELDERALRALMQRAWDNEIAALDRELNATN